MKVMVIAIVVSTLGKLPPKCQEKRLGGQEIKEKIMKILIKSL